MARVPVAQTSFNRGELDPGLYGRQDWQAYFSGAKRLRNMICRTQGGAVKRGGTQTVDRALSSTEPTRLIPFRFSSVQTYGLEFTGNRFRVLMNGGVLTYPAGHPQAGQEVVIASPFAAADLARLKYAQNEDVLVLTHPSYQPRILIRHSHYAWEFQLLEIGASIAPPAVLSLTLDGRNSVKYVVAAVNAGGEESLPSDMVQCATASGVGIPVPNYESLTIQQCHSLWVDQYGQAWPAEWDIWNMDAQQLRAYLVEYLGYGKGYQFNDNGTIKWVMYWPEGGEFWNLKDDTYAWFMEAINGTDVPWGTVRQSMRDRIRQYVTAFNENATATGHSALSWQAVPGAIRYTVYRSIVTDAGEKFYKLGDSTATVFDDNNLAFASTQQPQTALQPFDGPGNYPGVCTFYMQRLFLGRTDNKPGTFWASQTGAFRNFNRSESVSDTSSFEFTIEADWGNEILWMKSMDDVLMGTAGGEFRVYGPGGPITPTNIAVTRQSNYGCSPLDPVIVGQSVIGTGASNRVLRAYRYADADRAYRSKDISHYADHLFEGAGRDIISIASQTDPDSIMWVVLADGALLACAYVEDEEVLGWSRCDTDGRFEEVVSLLEVGGAEEVLFLVLREVNGQTVRFIERLKTISTPRDNVEDAWHVDCGLEYTGEARSEFFGLHNLEGKQVVCLGNGNVYSGLTVTGGRIVLPDPVTRAIVGLPFTSEIETLEMQLMGDIPGVSASVRRAATASILFYNSRECWYGTPGKKMYELIFRTDEDAYGQPMRPKTVRHNVIVPAPAGGNGAGLVLQSRDPVPFGVLSLTLFFAVGNTSPRHGRKLGA